MIVQKVYKKNCLFVSIIYIIQTVSEKNQKEFKDLLFKLLRTYGNLSKLLSHTKLILKKHIQ